MLYRRIIDLTWRVDLQTADKAKENLEKAKGGHLGTHFDVMNKEFLLEYMERDAVVFDVTECGTERDITLDDIDINALCPKAASWLSAQAISKRLAMASRSTSITILNSRCS